jgi:hypothetical protein
MSDYRSPCIRRLALTARSLSRCYGCVMPNGAARARITKLTDETCRS